MQMIKDFKRSMIWKDKYPDTPAVSMSNLLQRSWRDAQSVVNDQQGAVVLFGQGKVEGVLVPPSLIYENRRKLPSAKYSEPVFHVSAQEFKNSYHHNTNSNICADFLNGGASVIVVDKGGAPVLGLVPMQEAALLGFNEKGQVHYNEGDGGPRLFTSGESYEEGAWVRNDTLCAMPAERQRLDHVIDVIDSSKQNRDEIHQAVRELRFDFD